MSRFSKHILLTTYVDRIVEQLVFILTFANALSHSLLSCASVSVMKFASFLCL